MNAPAEKPTVLHAAELPDNNGLWLDERGHYYTLAAAREPATAAKIEGPTTPASGRTDWQYCPECGGLEFKEGNVKRERWCSDCGQAWFPHIDYTDAVQANLAAVVALREQVTRQERILQAAVRVANALQNMGDFWAYGMAKAEDAAETVEDANAVTSISAEAAASLVAYRKAIGDIPFTAARIAPAIKELLEASQDAREAARRVSEDGFPRIAATVLKLCRQADLVSVLYPGPQSADAEEVGLKFCCAKDEASADLIAKQRNVIQSILAGAHPKEAWNRIMGDEKFSDAPTYAPGKWISVPLEIDRAHHRPVLGTWNACMGEMATLETTWSRLVTAITGGHS